MYPQPFPRPPSTYVGEQGLGLFDVLVTRAQAEPLNAIATGLFILAILHTFVAPRFLAASHRLREKAQSAGGTGDSDHPNVFRAEILHFFGEIEAVFGLWCVPLIAAVTAMKGWKPAEAWVGHGVNFTEPVFVVVVMAIASTRPVLQFAEGAIGLLAGLGRRTPAAWWLATLTIGPILGSFITEPAAMIISALLLSRQVFALGPSERLKYGTLGLLFVNISVGGTLTHFAAPPVLMVAGTWGWGLSHMLGHFGWKAIIGIVLSNAAYALLFRRELKELGTSSGTRGAGEPGRGKAVPGWIVAVHLTFLAYTVATAHYVPLFVGGFLFFLAFLQATSPHQGALNLRPPLLVGFFLAGLVVHGSLQTWWLEPVLTRLAAFPLFLGATVLTAFNDNAAITYLASLVPGFDDAMKYAVVAGAVAGGGLTVIANAPNPAGQSVLAVHFPNGVAPGKLALAALLPTLLVGACFWLL